MSTATKRLVTAFCVFLVAGAACAGVAPDASAVKAGLNAAAMARLSVSEAFIKTGKWAESNAAAGYEAPSGGPASVNVGPGGVITVDFGGPSITLTPSDGGKGQVDWSCKGTGLAADVLPQECR